MKPNSYELHLDSNAESLIRTALSLTGKVEFSKDSKIMSIPIKGNIILIFNDNVTDNLIIELEHDTS